MGIVYANLSVVIGCVFLSALKTVSEYVSQATDRNQTSKEHGWAYTLALLFQRYIPMKEGTNEFQITLLHAIIFANLMAILVFFRNVEGSRRRYRQKIEAVEVDSSTDPEYDD